jgi:hypothetical protein
MMNVKFAGVLALLLGTASSAMAAESHFVGGGSDNLWSNPANWVGGQIPTSATTVGADFENVAVARNNGVTTLIDSSVNAVGFAVQWGADLPGHPFAQASSNTLNMTGGTLTQQGGFLMNIGRGRSTNPNQIARFNMSGGVVNSAGITVPEAFNPADLPDPTASVGVRAEMDVSGNAIINTDLLRLGAQDSRSKVTIRDNAQVNLNNNNLGFSNGQLWLESFEFPNTGAPDVSVSGVTGTSLLDLRDCGVLRISGGVNGVGNDQARSLAIIRNTLIPQGWLVANGGSSQVHSALVNGVILLAADPTKIPEPTSVALLVLSSSALLMVRRRMVRG